MHATTTELNVKVWPEFFLDIAHGTKTFEVRRDDRPYRPGKYLDLREWDPETEDYTGRHVLTRITYKLDGGQFGVEEGYCVLGFAFVHACDGQDG